ncbi:MAG: hypothetical protein DHS20C20_02050 [Ardenticatenaceae bacterium]|nr:MAG: hypothetical protein DHS20C20_02050 [Ardenticatenaceae bacterium]
MITHHNAVVANHKQLIDKVAPQLKEEMEAEAFAAAWQTGKEMAFDTAVALVRSALKSVEK